MRKYDFQKPSKIPYLEMTGMPTRILLRKRRFKCYQCSKIAVAETSLVKKNHQIPRIINQKIAQKLIEKTSMTDIAHQLSIPTSIVIHKLNDFHLNHDFTWLPEIMFWDECAFTKGKMSFIAQDFDKLNIITVLERRTQAVIRNHFLRYDRTVCCQVKIITMDMFSPYYDLAKQLYPSAKIVLDRFHISRIKRKSSTPFNYLIPTPNWKQLIISLNSSNAMLLVFETLKTSKKGFSSLSTSKKKGRISSFLELN